MSPSSTTQSVKATLVRGGMAGMIAGAAMAMFAMVASVTYQDHGFFTPLFHISALFGSALVAAGATYGVAVFVVSAVFGLPVAARITGSGSTIADMASMVGWATFAVEHFDLRARARDDCRARAHAPMARPPMWWTLDRRCCAR